jgi:hypothetical protein
MSDQIKVNVEFPNGKKENMVVEEVFLVVNGNGADMRTYALHCSLKTIIFTAAKALQLAINGLNEDEDK